MAAHIGYLVGNRGEVSRLGSKASGVRAKARGWRIGGAVYSCTITDDAGAETECVVLTLTAGSNGGAVPYVRVVISEHDTPRQIAADLHFAAERLEAQADAREQGIG
jgi:hypothetical protein